MLSSKICNKANGARNDWDQSANSFAAGMHMSFISWTEFYWFGFFFFIELSHKRLRLVHRIFF